MYFFFNLTVLTVKVDIASPTNILDIKLSFTCLILKHKYCAVVYVEYVVPRQSKHIKFTFIQGKIHFSLMENLHASSLLGKAVVQNWKDFC